MLFRSVRIFLDTYGAVMVHVKNEGKRTAIQAKVDRMHGQTKGASDINIPGSRSFILEMKRKDHTKSGWETGQQEYLNGMRFDPRIPTDVKQALCEKSQEIYDFVEDAQNDG